MLINILNNEEELHNLNPWYKGYFGEIIPKDDGSGVELRGIVEVDEANCLVHIK